MKIGDLVRYRSDYAPEKGMPTNHNGLVVDVIKKKVWRTSLMGKRVEWGKVKPEPHAVVLWHHDGSVINVPAVDLEVIDDSA